MTTGVQIAINIRLAFIRQGLSYQFESDGATRGSDLGVEGFSSTSSPCSLGRTRPVINPGHSHPPSGELSRKAPREAKRGS